MLHSSIHDGLIELVPLLYEAFFRMRNVSHPGPIHSLMQHTADLIFSDLDKNIDSMFAIIIFSYNTSLETWEFDRTFWNRKNFVILKDINSRIGSNVPNWS